MSAIAHTSISNRIDLSDACVRDLMTPDPVTVYHRITIREAAGILDDRGIGVVLVVDAGDRVVGVLNRSDVLRAVLAGAEEFPVRNFMSPGLIAVKPGANARQVAEFMVCCEVQRIFVVGEDGSPVGVVSTTDIVRTIKSRWSSYVPTFRKSAQAPRRHHVPKEFTS